MQDITVVFFIENHYQEKLLLFNDAFNNFENILLLYSDMVPSLNYPDISITNKAIFEDSLAELLPQIKTKWFIHLKAEEVLPGFYKWWENLSDDFYFVKIEKMLNKEFYDNLISFQLRLYNKESLLSGNFSLKNYENRTLDLKIFDYSHYYPNLLKNKLKKYKDLYNKGDKRLSIIAFLFGNSELDFETMINFYKSLSIEKLKSGELNDITANIAEYYLSSGDYESANKILLQNNSYINNSPKTFFLLGKTAMAKEDYSGAVTYFEKTRSLYKNNDYYKFVEFPFSWITYQALLNLGEAYLKLENLEMARAAFEQTLTFVPNEKTAIEKLTEIEKKMHNHPEYNRALGFSCQSCGNCCRFQNINITNNDLYKIMQNRPDLDVSDIVDFAESSGIVKNLSAERFISEDKEKWMILKKKKASRDCVFLTEDNLCSINDFKPLICKSWPFSLRSHDQFIDISYNNRDFIKKYCSHKSIEGSMNYQELKKTLKNFEKEREEYVSLVYRWNKMSMFSKNDKSYFDYIMRNTNYYFENKSRETILNLISYFSEIKSVKVIIEDSVIQADNPEIINILNISVYLESMDNDNICKIFEIMQELDPDFIPETNNKNTYYLEIEGININIYLMNLEIINQSIPQNSKVLYNPDNLEIIMHNKDDLVKRNLEAMKKVYYDNINHLRNDYQEKLLDINYNILLSSLSWLNKTNFNLINLPLLEIKPDNYFELFSEYLALKSGKYIDIEKLIDSFEIAMNDLKGS